MRIAIIVLLLVFWLFLAFRALQTGDVARAGIYFLVGVGLTAYRVNK